MIRVPQPPPPPPPPPPGGRGPAPRGPCTFDGEPLPEGMTQETYREAWIALTDWQGEVTADQTLFRLWSIMRA